jgi:nucleotide-binding universal stress UspA family protein
VIQQVLVALDLSFASGHTCAVARQWAELFGAQLRVIHVEEPLLPAVGPMMPLVATLPYQRDLSRSDFWNALPVDGKVVRSGEPAEAIAAEAIQSGADLLVVGSHGHGWSDRLLLGGTAEVLLQRPPAMTLVVPSILPGPAHTAEASALSLAAAAAH